MEMFSLVIMETILAKLKLKLDNSEGGRKLKVGFRVDGEPPTGVGGMIKPNWLKEQLDMSQMMS